MNQVATQTQETKSQVRKLKAIIASETQETKMEFGNTHPISAKQMKCWFALTKDREAASTIKNFWNHTQKTQEAARKTRKSKS